MLKKWDLIYLGRPERRNKIWDIEIYLEDFLNISSFQITIERVWTVSDRHKERISIIMEDGFMKTSDECISYFGVDAERGLSSRQVEDNRKKYGPNGELSQSSNSWKVIRVDYHIIPDLPFLLEFKL